MIACSNVQHVVKVKSMKKFWALLWSKGAKIGPEIRFFAIISSLLHQFSLKLHTMIACSNVQHVVKVKSMKKFWALMWSKGAKIGPEVRFFAIFTSLLHQFSLKLHTVIACSNVQHVIKVKSMKKFWALIWSKGAKIGPEIRFFAIFSSLLHQFSLKLHTVIACKNVSHVVEVKSMKKSFGP